MFVGVVSLNPVGNVILDAVVDFCLDVVGGGLFTFVVVSQPSVGTVVAGPVTFEVVDS